MSVLQKQLPIRWILPVVQLAVAAAAIGLSPVTEPGADVVPRDTFDVQSTWDGERPVWVAWLFAIDFPPLVLSLPVAILFGVYSLPHRVFFILSVVLFWHWIGHSIDKQRGLVAVSELRLGRSPRMVLLALGLGLSSFIGILLVLEFFQVSIREPVVKLICLAWSAAFAVFFARKMVLAIRAWQKAS